MPRNRAKTRKPQRKSRDSSGRFQLGNKVGRRGGRPRIDAAPEVVGRGLRALRHRQGQVREILDGWENIVTKLGTRADKRSGGRFCFDQVAGELARDLWRGNDIASRVIEFLPREAMRRGFGVKIKDADIEARQAFETRLQELGIRSGYKSALEFERAYGGSALWPIINDGQADLAMPLDEEHIHTFTGVRVLEARELRPYRRYTTDADGRAGEVEIWEYRARRRVSTQRILIHESRLVIFPGIRVAFDVDGAELGHGESVLSRFYNALMDYEAGIGGAAHLLQDFSQGVMKIKGLSDMVGNAESEQEVVQHFAVIDLVRSIVNSVVLDSEDDFSRHSTDMSGLPDTLDRLERRVAAGADLPLTVVFGMSPGGLNATGENDRAFVDDRTSALQTDRTPQAERLVKLAFLAQDGPTGGVEPESWKVFWYPLRQMSDAEIVDLRAKQATTDIQYIDAGVLTGEQVMRLRFGGEEYSYETHVDLEEFDRAKITAEDEARAAAASGTSDVQKTAFNGAQIASMIEVMRATAAGEIPRDGAQAALSLALQITPEEAARVLGDPNFTPALAAPPAAFGAPAPAGGEEPDTSGLRADAVGHGVMVALYPPSEIVDAMTANGGADADAMHVTIAYLGKELTEEQVDAAVRVVRRWAATTPPIDGTFNGSARFSASSTSDGKDVIVALLDSPALTRERPRLVDMLAKAGVPASESHGYCAHMTIGYVDPALYVPIQRVEPIAGVFSLAVSAGLSRVEVPFGGEG